MCAATLILICSSKLWCDKFTLHALWLQDTKYAILLFAFDAVRVSLTEMPEEFVAYDGPFGASILFVIYYCNLFTTRLPYRRAGSVKV